MRRSTRRNLIGYAFILPNFLGFLIFTSGPVIVSLCLAFADWDIITPVKFAGLANFRGVLSDLLFWKYLWNTLFMMSAIPLSMGFALAIAMVLNQKLRGRTFFRTIFFLPSITAGIALYILWRRIFNKDFGLLGRLLPELPVRLICSVETLGLYFLFGFAAYFLCRLVLFLGRCRCKLRLRRFLLTAAGAWMLMLLNASLTQHIGVPPILPAASWLSSLNGSAGATGWLNDPWLAKPSLMMMGLWTTMGGYNMILYLAALQNIDPQLYEAADIDGANSRQRFLHITWPMLTPTTFFIFITNCIGGFQGGFNAAYIMTRGGPVSTGVPWAPWTGEAVGETTTLSYYIFNNAYVYLKMGYAAAMAWCLFLLVFGVTLVNWKYGGRRVEY